VSRGKHLKQAWRRFAWAAVLIVSSGLPARAQTIPVWPEIDTYIKVDDRIRLYFLATTVQENRVSIAPYRAKQLLDLWRRGLHRG
jgi:hypothetical protein